MLISYFLMECLSFITCKKWTLTFVADETELGMVEQQEVPRAIAKPTQKRKPQSKYSVDK